MTLSTFSNKNTFIYEAHLKNLEILTLNYKGDPYKKLTIEIAPNDTLEMVKKKACKTLKINQEEYIIAVDNEPKIFQGTLVATCLMHKFEFCLQKLPQEKV